MMSKRLESPLLHIERLTKDFPGIRALNDVTMSLHRGEVLGVVGENGAGKSTLMKIIAGIEQPTAGEIAIEGKRVSITSTHEADRHGIAMIHQELNLVDELSVADNIFLGREHLRRIAGIPLVSDRAQRKAAAEALRRVNSEINPANRVRSLSIAQQQLVEIAKALSMNARLLIMDEPTAVLSERETSALFRLIAELKRQGVTILYVSHHLSEVIAICDRVLVLRDGCVVKSLEASGVSESELASLMVGRPLGDYFPPRTETRGPRRLRVRGLASGESVGEATFDVRAGEILGFAGLIGAGRTEMAEALVGVRHRSAGEIEMDGVRVNPRSPGEAAACGIAYLSEDRKGRGLTIDMGVAENVTLVSLRKYAHGLIHLKAEEAAAQAHINRLRIRVPTNGVRKPVRNLSGGNQQKVALAKWLETGPRVLILDEPTRGVDVGAKREIYDLIVELASRGMACVFISSELPELLGVCHRIAVMREGTVAAIFEAEDANEERIMHFAAGVDQRVSSRP